MHDGPPNSPPPDWNTFTLDLFCPRCEYNLRMLTGSRCPECGLILDWPRIVAVAEQRVNNPLFEYRWRDRPVRSFLHTTRLCVQPWRLWKGLSIADFPRPAGEFVFALLISSLYVIAVVVANAFGLAMLMSFYGRGTNVIVHRVLTLIPDFLMSALLDFVTHGFIIVLFWLYLQIFQQTISRHHIRRQQLLRIVLFTYVSLLMVKCLTVLPLLAECAYMPPAWFRPLITYSYPAIDAFAVFMVFVSTGFGLHKYLRIERAWAVATCVFALVLLTSITPIVLSGIAFDTWSNPVIRTLGSAWPGAGQLLWRLISP